MKDFQIKLLSDFQWKRITFDELKEKFPLDEGELNFKFFEKEIKQCELEKDNKGFYYLCCLLPFPSNFSDEISILVSKYLLKDWHLCHEEIIKYLEMTKVNACIQNIYKSMQIEFTYMIDTDTYDPFVRRCAYTLSKTGNKEAIICLRTLSNSNNEIVKKHCIYQLEKYNLS
jgi:hypothetical protein